MELYQLKHFVAVVEARGFTKGAERAAVSQPAISASIARLEAELNLKLLERKHAQVVPTAAGSRFFEAAKAIMRSCNAAKSELRSAPKDKPLRLGVMRPLSSSSVTGLLDAFQCANPEISIEAVDGHCDEWCHCDDLLGPLGEGKREAVLAILNERIGAKYASRVLFTAPYMLAVRADHRFAKRQIVTVSDLESERLILPERCVFLSDVTSALASLASRARAVYRTDSDDRALALVSAGLGLALVPAQPEIPAVKQVPVADLAISRTTGLLWERTHRDGRLDKFISFAESHWCVH